MKRVIPLSCCAAIAMGLAACGKKEEVAAPAPAVSPSATPSVSSPSPTAVAAASPDKSLALARAAEGTRNVHFGDKLQLEGAVVTRGDDGVKVELYWESLADQPLDYTILVHAVNERGDILTQADQPQGASTRAAKAGETWQDPVRVDADQLKGADAIAIGVYHPGGDSLKADRGRRDWNNVRLWIPLPAAK